MLSLQGRNVTRLCMHTLQAKWLASGLKETASEHSKCV